MEGLESLPQAAFQDLVVLTFKILAEEETEEAIAGPFSPLSWGCVARESSCAVCGHCCPRRRSWRERRSI